MAKHHYFAAMTRNATSLIGTTLVVGSLSLIATLIAVQLLGLRGGAYLGIVTFVLLPMVLALGLVLIFVGIRRQRKRGEAVAGTDESRFPVLDLNKERTRKSIVGLVILATISAVVLAAATFKGVEVMDSTAFCGTVCHTVMQPEYTAHQRSPHARVACADCHIGPGADWFVKSKISGSWQLIAVTLNLYPTPIPTPVHDLRPARDTCEQCHWPTKFAGDKLRVRVHYSEDEQNTALHNVVLLKIGGEHGRKSSGIHWHVDPGVTIRYLSDDKREKIYDVEMTGKDGVKTVFKASDEAPAGSEWRTMDCVDCHNRPTHIYRLPQNEIDVAMDQGMIDKALPFIKREGLRAVQVEYPSHEAARTGIAQDISGFYAANYPDVAAQQAGAVAAAGKALGDIYAWNVFPAMKVTWGSYPSHVGHKDSPGCFRCHDRKHKTGDGAKISKDCGLCHTVLADEEEDPAILRQISGEEEPEAPAEQAAAPAAEAAATTTAVEPQSRGSAGG
jgi:hypothetical protein